MDKLFSFADENRVRESAAKVRDDVRGQLAKAGESQLKIDSTRIDAETRKRRDGSAFERKMKEGGKSQKTRERWETMSGYADMWRFSFAIS